MGQFIKIRDYPPLPVYIATPSGDPPYPTVLLFMHAHGVDVSQKKVCNDLANAGYLAIAGDAYQEGKYNFQTQTDELIFEAFDFVLNYAKSLPNVDKSRLGLIGFCMGGRHTYLAVSKYKEFKVAVSYYGFPHRGKTAESTPQSLINKFNAPVLSIFGARDQGIPREVVINYKKASEGSNKPHKTIVYENAGHGFLNPNSRNHDIEASNSAWKETLKFFESYL